MSRSYLDATLMRANRGGAFGNSFLPRPIRSFGPNNLEKMTVGGPSALVPQLPNNAQPMLGIVALIHSFLHTA